MTNTKHTPGPWLVHDKSTLHMNDLTIASTLNYRIVTHHRNAAQKAGEDARNAHLIAAAPDLLAACRAAIADDTGWDVPMSKAVQDLLRAAIAKATGVERESSDVPNSTKDKPHG